MCMKVVKESFPISDSGEIGKIKNHAYHFTVTEQLILVCENSFPNWLKSLLQNDTPI